MPTITVLPPNYGTMESGTSPVSAPPFNEETPEQGLLAKSDLSLSTLYRNPDKRRPYIQAMACQTTRNTAELCATTARGLLSMLAGIQFSGLLNSKTFATLSGNFYLNAACPPYANSLYDQINVSSPGISLKESLDKHFGVSLDAATYAAAISWFVAHSTLPRIQRSLMAKEEASIQQLLGDTNPPLETAPSNSTASKINSLIEYAMPVTFDASRYALFIKALQQSGSYFYLPVSEGGYIQLGEAGFNANGLVTFDTLTFEMDPGNSPLSDAALYALMGSGIAMYAIQALCNFQNDLQSKSATASTPSIRSFSKEEWKKYIGALVCRGAQKGGEVLNEAIRSSVATLSGLQLSGLLDAKVITALLGAFSLQGSCPGQKSISTFLPAGAVTPIQTLGDIIDSRLIVSVDTLTYGIAATWLAAQTLIPRIQRRLKTKEETLISEILEADGGKNGAESIVPAKDSTATKISSFMEYFMPVMFNGAAYALLFHGLEKSKGIMSIYSDAPETWNLSDQNMVVDLAAGIYDIATGIMADETTIPEGALGLILTTGIMMFLYQAWNYFHENLQKRGNDSTSTSRNHPLNFPDSCENL